MRTHIDSLLLVLLMICLTGLMACEGDIPIEGDEAGECDDLEDNDGDGSIDCDDPGCAADDACTGDDDDDNDSGDDDDAVDWDLCINEFQASNSSTIEDGTGAFPDWVELYNLTDADIDLEGYYITDNLSDPTKHMLGALTLPANGFLLLWADGDIDQGDDHLPYQLAKSGEELGLYDPDGDPINELEYLPQITDWSAARFPDGSTGWDIDTTPTPEALNGQENDS